jgi:hypothetical protein
MQFASILAASALVASVFAGNHTTSAASEVIVTATTIATDLVTVACTSGTNVVGTYTTYVTEATQVTITNCGCTLKQTYTYTSKVYCNTCSVATTAPVYTNATIATTVASTAASTKTAVGTTSVKATASATPSTITASGANKVAMSGASLAGLLGLAAYLL